MQKSILILLILLPLTLKAQVVPGGWEGEARLEDLQHHMHQQSALSNDGLETKGSPFLYNEYRKGDIYFSNQSKALNQSIKFNCYTEQLLHSHEGKEYFFSPDQLDIFIIRSETDTLVQSFKNIFVKSRSKRMFFEVLYEGSVHLLKRHEKEYFEADYLRPYSTNRQYHEYLDKNKYFIRTAEGDIIKFRPGNRQVIRLLKDRSEELQNYIRSNELEAANERDLIEMVRYYNSLTIQFQ